MNSSGILLCLRYCLPPNALSYCGPDDTVELLHYRKEGKADKGLVSLTTQFATLYQYLMLIAHANNIPDPFHPKVVDAYWIGNALLEVVQPGLMYSHFIDTMKLPKLLRKKDATVLFDKLNMAFIPHHTYHVLNVVRRTGHIPIEQTVETMDACRIGWGKVVTTDKQMLTVTTQSLEIKEGKLVLGKPVQKKIANSLGLVPELIYPKVGQWVSFHWHVACDILTPLQAASLKRHTLAAIKVANTTI